MAVYTELDHLIALSDSPQNAVALYEDEDAVNDRIAEWFETPQGTLADMPSWGNQLWSVKHEPISEALEILMEAKVLHKLSIDCNLSIAGIRIDFVDVDRVDIAVLHQAGVFRREMYR